MLVVQFKKKMSHFFPLKKRVADIKLYKTKEM